MEPNRHRFFFSVNVRKSCRLNEMKRHQTNSYFLNEELQRSMQSPRKAVGGTHPSAVLPLKALSADLQFS